MYTCPIIMTSSRLAFWVCVFTYVRHVLTCLDDRCKRQQFVKYPGRSYVGQYMIHSGPLPYRDCQRLCRQYIECEAFIMEMLGDSDKFGYCGLIKGHVMKTDFTEHAQFILYGRYTISRIMRSLTCTFRVEFTTRFKSGFSLT
jgi:hypothetical protein